MTVLAAAAVRGGRWGPRRGSRASNRRDGGVVSGGGAEICGACLVDVWARPGGAYAEVRTIDLAHRRDQAARRRGAAATVREYLQLGVQENSEKREKQRGGCVKVLVPHALAACWVLRSESALLQDLVCCWGACAAADTERDAACAVTGERSTPLYGTRGRAPAHRGRREKGRWGSPCQGAPRRPSPSTTS